MRRATTAEINRWDTLVAANVGGPQILQTRAWGEFKARWGWKPQYLIHDDGARELAMLFLRRRIPGLGELWYSPKGPAIADPEQLPDLLPIHGIAESAFLLKVEPEIHADSDLSSWASAGLIKARHDVQISRATILVDLQPTEDALLESFKSKTRYNIRLAAKKGVTVRQVEVNDDSVEAMFRLMSATQARAGFTLRKRRYFEDYWRLQHASDQGQFFFAMLGDEVLAGVFVTYLGERAWYKDGGSSRRHSELMAPHLLQWEVMRWLKMRGVTSYDLVAVPRPSELSEEHPLYGLYRFKSGFNETITEYVGTWDYPVDARRYGLWNRGVERMAHQWSYRVRGDLLY